MKSATVLARLDGVASMRELIRAGLSPRTVQRDTERGALIRVRRGIYAVPDADDRIVSAARVGGRVAGATAAAFHGLWIPEHRELVVDVGRVADLRDPRDGSRPLSDQSPPVRVMWTRKPPSGRRLGISPLTDIVGQVLRSEPTFAAIAVLDSMVNRTPMSEHDIWAAARGLPLTVQARLVLMDPRAESGTESIVRVRLQQAGFRVVPQFRLPYSDLERVDMIVEDRIIVECDSSFHDDPRVRDRDSARDLALAALGYVVLRVRYRTAMSDPDAIVAAVTTLLRRLDRRESVAI